MPLSRILGTLTTWNPLGLSGHVKGLLFYVQNTQVHSVVIKQVLNIERGGISGKGKCKVHLRTGHEGPKGE